MGFAPIAIFFELRIAGVFDDCEAYVLRVILSGAPLRRGVEGSAVPLLSEGHPLRSFNSP
jgi:hypothetical protein